jgi:uncharacterized protein (TIGR03067 family)
MNRFPVRPVAALLLLAIVAALPVVYRQAERRRQLAPFQGEWDVLGYAHDGTTGLAPDGREAVVAGDRLTVIDPASPAKPGGGHYVIGPVDPAADPPRLALSVAYDIGEVVGSWQGYYRFRGADLVIALTYLSPAGRDWPAGDTLILRRRR